jgi:CDP-glycerol glycerophosphotransferase (TagB/SpsB family)
MDNAYYLYKYMQKVGCKKQMQWVIYDKNIYNILKQKNIENIYLLKSLSGVWVYLRSKYIISSSSSLWQIKAPTQKHFELWHGIPLKTIGNMGETNLKAGRLAPSVDIRFATSSLEKALLSASFDYNASKITVTGQPRTDALFEDSKYLSSLLKVDIEKYDKIAFYMPTYRHGFKGKNEGKKFDEKNIFRMENYDHPMFLDFLKSNKILLLLKLHPFEEAIYTQSNLGENIYWITNELLIGNDIGVYDILSEVDMLITDYSSVYFDYLLLDRKVVFMPLDLEQYEATRGFQVEPYDFWTPGKKVFKQSAFQDALLAKDSLAEKQQRKQIRDIMFTYQDNQSSKRIFEIIKNNMGE